MKLFLWIWGERSWLFSGIGMGFFAWICKFVQKYHRSRKSITPTSEEKTSQNNSAATKCLVGYTATATAHNTATTAVHNYNYYVGLKSDKPADSRPTPIEIKKAISNVPLYLQQRVRESYSGISIDWNMRVLSVTSRPIDSLDNNRVAEEMLKVGAGYWEEGEAQLVQFEVAAEEFPLLRTVKLNQDIRVVGKILDVDIIYINTKPIKIYI